MSDSKTFILPETGASNSLMPLLTSMCQSKGIDPNVLLAMRNSNGFGGEGGWFMWVIFLFFLMGWGNWGGNGFAGNVGCGCSGNLASLISNDSGKELLMSAIQGNGNAIGQLATKLNCDVNAIQGALHSLATQLQGIGSQVGLSGQQVINAIQSGNASLASQLAQCCCDNKLAICQQTNALQSEINRVGTNVERGFSAVAYEGQAQTCDLKNNANANTREILNKLSEMQTNALQDKLANANTEIASLKAIIDNNHQTQTFAAMLSPIQADLNAIKAKQPNTVPVQWPQLTAIPTSQLYGYGYGYNGYNGNGWA